MANNWDGYGPNWDKLRKKTYKRDNYTCQRCGYNPEKHTYTVPLQAHHIIPRSRGGKDSLDNLITLCRRCHGVQHPDNEAFDDDRPKAPLFPHPDAPEVITTYPKDASKSCNRCKKYYSKPSELVGIPRSLVNDIDYALPVCKPCAGVICYDSESDVDMNDLEGMGDINRSETINQKNKAHPYPRTSSKDIANSTREKNNNTEKLLLHNFTRKHGSIISISILTVLIHFIFAPLFIESYSEATNSTALIISLILALLFHPLLRWSGTTVLYRIISFLDYTHKKSHYKPGLKSAISSTIASYLLTGVFVIILFVILLIV